MKKTIALSLSIMLLWSCNNTGEKTASQTASEQTTSHAQESEAAIELNNGEKWLVNEEMKPFVQNGGELVTAYIQENQTDYKTLAVQLKDENTQLIKSCTMTGKSHEELHKWLHPHIALVGNLEQETEQAKANEIILQLQASYQEYHQYFQ